MRPTAWSSRPGAARGWASSLWSTCRTRSLGQLTAAERDAAKDRARTARLDANVKVRAAELALQRAHRNHRDTAPYLAAADRADEAYQAACAELDKYEPRRDPFANLPGGGV